ncbi:MAG: hypothetical protein J6O51_00970 [Bacteroidales bacterium]|nr:hypothetical protein [Bacteroidales bacterium]
MKQSEQPNKITLHVEDPETLRLVTPEEWFDIEPCADPTAADWIRISNAEGQSFFLYKYEVPDELPFQKAKDAALAKGCDTGTRKQWIDIYDAIHAAGLNQLLTSLGGDPIMRKYYWTSERDSDQSTSNYAWLFNGTIGSLNYGYRVNAYAARLFRASEN